MTNISRLLTAMLVIALSTLLGIIAAWPIYESWWLVVAAVAGAVIGAGLAALGAGRLSVLATSGVLLGLYVLTVVPVAVPRAFESLPSGLLRGLLDGVAGIVLGWKQLLTLTLPVGTYQAVMVPAYLVFLVSAFVATTLALRAGRFAPLAALPLLVPVAFGTVFGSSSLSRALGQGFFSVVAPRELGLWLAAAAVGAGWVWFSAGAARRAALKLGRVPGEKRTGGGRAVRVLIGAGTVLVALVAGLALAPVLDSNTRQVPRDRIDPEIVLRERTSPLASYRAFKRDATLDAPVFEVTSSSDLPEQLRLAVLDTYDGVDFHIGKDALGRFTRFPSGTEVSDPATVRVAISEGYSDVWVPTAGLGSVPVFSGPRATELADAFYVNRLTEAAIAVPGGRDTTGLESGDGFSVIMQTTPAEPLTGGPAAGGATIDLESMPELAAWLKAQDQPATAEGLTELIDRLRQRGYLSHSIGQSEGEQLWLERLSARYGTSFQSSAGGHSLARIEQLFSQLNTQQRLAGEDTSAEMLVAAVGDDEQFATAAALIARALGFDSRVVLGVRLGDEQAGVPGVPACLDECTGEHLAAWVEVRGREGVWVPIDVTPQVTLRPTTLEEGEQLPEFATTPEERDAREVDPPLGLGERSETSDVTEDEVASSWLIPVLRTVGLSAAALLLLAVPLLFLPFAKRRREKARRTEVDPELKALGAWQQLVDSAVDAGIEIEPSASRAEIGEKLGTAPARWASGIAAKAVFSAQGVTDEEAEWMWAAVEADRAERSAGMSLKQRLRARYALGTYGVKLVQLFGRRAESATAQSDSDR